MGKRILGIKQVMFATVSSARAEIELKYRNKKETKVTSFNS